MKILFLGNWKHSRLVLCMLSILSVAFTLADSTNCRWNDTAGFAHIMRSASVCPSLDWAVLRSPAESE